MYPFWNNVGVDFVNELISDITDLFRIISLLDFLCAFGTLSSRLMNPLRNSLS